MTGRLEPYQTERSGEAAPPPASSHDSTGSVIPLDWKKQPLDKAAQHHLIVAAFEHAAFPVALGFVAGFVDIFGFMGLFGLLPAHVTGNLIFIAVDIARQQYNLIMNRNEMRAVAKF